MNFDDLTFSDEGKVRKGEPLGHYCMYYWPGGLDFNEVYVSLCDEFYPEIP